MGRLFEAQQDLPQFSGGGTTQRSESAGLASPPGHVPGSKGGGWPQRSVCGAVCYWSCLEWLRQWAPEPSAEWTKTTAEPPGSAASARRAPRWTCWSRLSWVPSRGVAVSIRVLDTSQVHDQSRREGVEAGGGAASCNHLAGFWLVSSARLRYGRLFPFCAWPGLDYSGGSWPPGVIVRVILRAHMLQDSHDER